MTEMNGAGGFPGMPGAMPGAMPGGFGAAPAAVQMPGVGFVLDIPPDPNWEPFETTDILEMDGFYACRISKESARTDGTKSAGMFIALEIQDEDARGKNISKFLPDPRGTRSNVWFVWRGLIRSITGGLDAARTGFQYRAGVFTGQMCYVKTEPYQDGEERRTSVAGFVTAAEYQEHVKNNRHRWPSKPKAAPGGLPGGMPAAFPMAAFPGMPGGGPQSPIGAAPGMTAPQPVAAAPMQAPPQAAPIAAPVAPPQNPFAQMQQPQPQHTFAFPGVQAPQQQVHPGFPAGAGFPGAAPAAPGPTGGFPASAFPGVKS